MTRHVRSWALADVAAFVAKTAPENNRLPLNSFALAPGFLRLNVSVGTILISLTLRVLGVPSATLLKKPALFALFWTFFAGISVAEFVQLEEAKEIIDGRTILTDPRLPVNTYKSSEDPANPDHEISDADWTGYTPPLPYIKNTSRNLQFNESDFIASPGAPDGVTTYIQTSDGYTWGSMSEAINALWPYNSADYSGLAAANAYYAGNLVTTPGEGVVKITVNFKAQNMKFYANEGGVPSNTSGAVKLDRYLVKDQWDNTYLMHATGQMDQSQVSAAFADAVLPAGWIKQTIQLDEDIVLHPARGADGSYHYLIFRDSADNSYHQIGWGSQGISLAAQVEGMPIWGGQAGDLLLGDAAGIIDDLIHGAGGDDTIRGGLGNDILWGDAGSDVAVLGDVLASYSLLGSSEDLTWMQLSGGGYTTDFHHVEFFQFSDVTLSADAVVRELGTLAVPEIDPAGMGSVLALVTGALGLLERRRLKAS